MTNATLDYQTEIANDFLKHATATAGPRRFLSSAFGPSLLFARKKVLVVGCGRGKDCSYFVQFGAAEIHGLDVCEDIGADFVHPRVRYHRCSAEQMEIRTATFDFVYSVATMEHIPHIDLALGEMVRVAKRGGLVYCFSAPLWHSREGHHKFGLFPGQPWIHLRMAKEELLAYCRANDIRSSPDYDIEFDVDFIYSDYFNREPAARFLDVCAKLPVSRTILNTTGQDPDAALPDMVWRELEVGGHSRQELLTIWHKFVAVK